MQLDVVNTSNKKVGALELRDEVFGNRVQDGPDLGSASGTSRPSPSRHARDQDPRRSRRLGQKLWKQKGTGRARVERRPQPDLAQGRHDARPAAARLRATRCPKKIALGALRDALAAKLRDGAGASWSTRWRSTEPKTPRPPRLLKGLGAHAQDAASSTRRRADALVLSTRNIAGVKLVPPTA